MPSQRTLTVVEGRPKSKKVVDDFKKAADERAWSFNAISGINSDKLARNDLGDIALDYVVFRNLSKNNYTEAERLIEYLKKTEAVCINLNPVGARIAISDKHFQQGLFMLDPFLCEYALPTFEAKSKANVMSYIKGRRVKFPILLKDRWGSIGENITFIKDEKGLDKVKSFANLLIEQYVEIDHDWRVFVIGGAAVGVMRKIGDESRPDNFVAWSAGRKKSKEEDLDMVELLGKIACQAASISGLEYTGVDIIQDKNTNKIYILETNYTAGWINGFPEATGVNVPDLVIDWLEERGDAKTQPIEKSIKRYIKNRKQYLSRKTRENYEKILAGEKGITKELAEQFKPYPSKYLYDAGLIFKKLAAAYENDLPAEDLIKEIEQMPLSWAGNFIGPEVGVLEDGAILSALYLYLLGKTKKV